MSKNPKIEDKITTQNLELLLQGLESLIKEKKERDQKENLKYLKDINFKTIFHVKNKSYLHMKLKPVNFLCNSNVINDSINRRNCIVCNLESGTVFIMNGDTEIVINSYNFVDMMEKER